MTFTKRQGDMQWEQLRVLSLCYSKMHLQIVSHGQHVTNKK